MLVYKVVCSTIDGAWQGIMPWRFRRNYRLNELTSALTPQAPLFAFETLEQALAWAEGFADDIVLECEAGGVRPLAYTPSAIDVCACKSLAEVSSLWLNMIPKGKARWYEEGLIGCDWVVPIRVILR